MADAALITGAAARVGRAMALDLAARGVDIAIHYSSSAGPAETVAEEARALGVKAVTLQADLLDDAAVAGLVGRAVDGLGTPLSILINNASIFEHDVVETLTLESWERAHRSNLKAPVFLAQAFAAQAPRAIKDANGEPLAQAQIVNMVDMRVRKLTPEFMSYTLAKHALWGFTQTAAQGLAPDVRVNAIGPGPTLRGGRQSEEHFAAQRAATILGRGASPAEICTALRFLLDSPGITGQLICVDGGQHLAWETPDVLGVE